jgi:hypothetical protein
MRTIRIKAYKFSELSAEAQQTAIDNYRDINTDYDWHETVYDDFESLCKTIAVDVDLKKTYFSGFYHQGSGSSFTAWVDVKACLEAIKADKWKQYAPLEEMKFYPVTDNMLRLCHLCSCNIEPTNRESSVRIDFDSDTYGKHTNIDAVIQEIEDFFEDMANTLNNWLYTTLEKEYEYLSSDEAVKDTIIANEYEFTKDGKLI